METLPPYEILLTGDDQALIAISAEERQFVAAVSQDDPPTTAYIIKSTVQFAPRIVAQLRENLKKKQIHVVEQYKLPHQMHPCVNSQRQNCSFQPKEYPSFTKR